MVGTVIVMVLVPLGVVMGVTVVVVVIRWYLLVAINPSVALLSGDVVASTSPASAVAV